MPTHIDHVSTDVIQQPAPQADDQGQAQDSRWQDENKYKEMAQRCQWLKQRLNAEGFDD